MAIAHILKKVFPTNIAPGYKVQVGEIPAFVTNEHNEVLFFWEKQGTSNILHIDAHSDMGSGCPILPSNRTHYDKVGYVNFICDAVYHNVVSSVYWYNPHSNDLIDFGSTDGEANRPSLEAAVGNGFFGTPELCWKLENGKIVNAGTLEAHNHGEQTTFNKFQSYDPFILDIDLDAFACINGRMKAIPGHDPEKDYEKRLDQTIDYLSQIRRPDMITITRSQAPLEQDSYTPAEQVDTIQDHLLLRLNEIYK